MVLPHQRRFRIALSLARLARPATPLIDRIAFLKPIAAMLALAPQKVPQKPSDAPSPATEKRSEEHTSELQSLMRISYAVFCLKKKKQQKQTINTHNTEYE